MIDQSSGSPARVLLIDFDAGEHGHRGQYNAMLARLFGTVRAPYSLASLLSPRPILFPMIEHGFGRFVLACLFRALFARRTVGFLFRPLPAAAETSLRMRVKRLLLTLLRSLPGARVMILIPFSVEPRLASVAHDWFHDLQNWDLAFDPPAPLAPQAAGLARQLRADAGGRPIVASVGYQLPDKAFDRFASLLSASPAAGNQLYFVYGGTVATELKAHARAFAAAGGFGLDRYVTDDELLAFYDAASIMWCAYAPDYDQASGIFGRALQLGVPVVVRSGSLVHRLCQADGHPHVPIEVGDSWEALAELPRPLSPAAARARAAAQGRTSLAKLEQALGLPALENPFVDADRA